MEGQEISDPATGSVNDVEEAKLASEETDAQGNLGEDPITSKATEFNMDEDTVHEKEVSAADILEDLDETISNVDEALEAKDSACKNENQTAMTTDTGVQEETSSGGSTFHCDASEETSRDEGEVKESASDESTARDIPKEAHEAEQKLLMNDQDKGNAENDVDLAQPLPQAEKMILTDQSQNPALHSVIDMPHDGTDGQPMGVVESILDETRSKDVETDGQQRDAVKDILVEEPSKNVDEALDPQLSSKSGQILDDPMRSEEDSSVDSCKSEEYVAVVKSIRESLAHSWEDQEFEDGDAGDSDVGISDTEVTREAQLGPWEKKAECAENNEEMSSCRPSDTNQSFTLESEVTFQEQMIIRDSLVKSLREKFERGPDFDVNNLSVDMEKFYLAQRAQQAEYQTKRREALSRNHCAKETYGNGLGEVDHSPGAPDKGLYNAQEEVQEDVRDVENDSESSTEEKKDMEDTGPDDEADADEMLTYVNKVWWKEAGDLSENVSSLLNFLSSGQGDAPTYPPQEVVEALRCRRWDFCGRRRDGQPDEEWIDTLLQQLCFNYLIDLEQQQIATRTIAESETNHLVEDSEVEEILSNLNTVLSNLESHIDALKSSRNNFSDGDTLDIQAGLAPKGMENVFNGETKEQDFGEGELTKAYPKTRRSNAFSGETKEQDFGATERNEPHPETRRSVASGELYSTSRWHMLQKNPACRLRNKIVLSDMDEVETVAVILKADQEQQTREAADSNLCVLNNEKPSALKKRVSQGKNLRVKFMLKQDSAGESTTGSNTRVQQPETSAICCWLC